MTILTTDIPSHDRLSLNFQCRDLQEHFLPKYNQRRMETEYGRGGTRRTIVMGEGVATQEPYQTVQFAYSILEGRPREAPAIPRFQFKGCLCCVRRSLFYVMSLIELVVQISEKYWNNLQIHARQYAPIQRRGGASFP